MVLSLYGRLGIEPAEESLEQGYCVEMGRSSVGIYHTPYLDLVSEPGNFSKGKKGLIRMTGLVKEVDISWYKKESLLGPLSAKRKKKPEFHMIIKEKDIERDRIISKNGVLIWLNSRAEQVSQNGNRTGSGKPGKNIPVLKDEDFEYYPEGCKGEMIFDVLGFLKKDVYRAWNRTITHEEELELLRIFAQRLDDPLNISV